MAADTNAEDIQSLMREAGVGDPGAMTAYGIKLLAGDGVPPAPSEGLDLLRRASKSGNGEAAAFLGVAAAAGLGRAQSWPDALDFLTRAAELGSSSARGQLAAIANEDKAALGGDDADRWGRLRGRIKAEEFVASPPKMILAETPRVRTIDGFLSSPLCDWMITRARPKLERARTYDSERNEGALSHSRTNTEAVFSFSDLDVALVLLQTRIGGIFGAPIFALEHSIVLHYEVGQRFNRHFDFLDSSLAGHAADIARRGQRVATALIYLNDDFEGGETDFPMAGLRFKGAKGDAIFFSNVDTAGQPDRLTLHAGLAPTRGEKWLFSQWIRGAPPPRAA